MSGLGRDFPKDGRTMLVCSFDLYCNKKKFPVEDLTDKSYDTNSASLQGVLFFVQAAWFVFHLSLQWNLDLTNLHLAKS